jgi:hypothetical protein
MNMALAHSICTGTNWAQHHPLKIQAPTLTLHHIDVITTVLHGYLEEWGTRGSVMVQGRVGDKGLGER